MRREYGGLAADKCSETFDSIIDKPKKLLESNNNYNVEEIFAMLTYVHYSIKIPMS